MHIAMDDNLIKLIADQIKQRIGVDVTGAQDNTQMRTGLSFWFENYTRSSGPIFSLHPLGLLRHKVTLKFGPYSASCIKHIQNRATRDDYALAYSLVQQLRKNFDVKINDSETENEWSVLTGLKISVTGKVENQHSVENIFESISAMMIPLIAAIAELIGYESEDNHDDKGDFDIEGDIYLQLMQKRERSPRNRLLCISIHGESCGLCGFVTQNIYGNAMPSIIEIHHIEPLSEIKNPRAYDPKTDLIPLCPNCHRAVHKRKPAFTLNELREMLKT